MNYFEMEKMSNQDSGLESIMVLECFACPKQSLVDNAEGTKAICSGLQDILWFSDYTCRAAAEEVGLLEMKVTSVNIGHGNCSDECSFRVEIRHHLSYDRELILSLIRKHTNCSFKISERQYA